MSAEIRQNKKIRMENLSENARRILFLLVAVPGGKNIAMLREALGLDEGRKSHEVNVLTIRFCEKLQSYVEKKERSPTVQGAAFSLLAIGVALRSGQPSPVIAQFKRFLDGSVATVDPVKSPLVSENRNRRKYLLVDFRSADTPYFSSAFERRLYIHCPPADIARVFASYLFFLSWGKLPRSKLVDVREDLLRTLPTVFITLGCGYPTTAAAMAAVLGPFLDAQTATELVEKVKAAEGLWLWPFVPPEETWQDALAELESLAKPKPRTRRANADEAAEGCIGWMLSFRSLGFSSKGDVFDLATVKPLLVRTNEYGHSQFEEIRQDDVLEIDLGVACSAELPFAVPEVGDAESVRHGAEGLYLLRRDFAAETAALAPAVAAFQRGEGDFFLISLKAGGMGLNLTAANYVILLDPWWNPAVENQAADRVHRIGQKNPVTIYRLIAANTVEERVLELHEEKKAIAADVLDGTGKSALTPEALMKLFG